MPRFTLKLTDRNLKIAEFLEDAERHIKTIRQKDSVTIKFGSGLTIFRLEISCITGGITDAEWKDLAKEIKSTLIGAKIREFSDQVIGIRPLRNRGVYIRLNAIEESLIREAAKLEGRTLSDFIRMAALRASDEVLERTKAIRESYGKGARRPDGKRRTYVS